MVAFHDRRNSTFDVNEIQSKVPAQHGDTFGKDLVGGRFLVQGVPTEEGRRYVLNEALPNGRVITHEDVFDKRGQAKKNATQRTPTTTYDI